MGNNIQNFLNDIGCLAPVTEYVNRVNIFDVLKLSELEIRHSNMLSWLMDPNGNHGLGDRVLKGIIEQGLGTTLASYDDFEIEREKNNIDISAVSKACKYVLCIENKINAPEANNQLERYKKITDGMYPEYMRSYVFLSPRGKNPSDPEHWAVMDYNQILQIIENACAEVCLKPEAELLINNYVDIIRRRTVGNDAIKGICEKIYRAHSDAIDEILQQKWDGEGSSIYRKYKTEMDLIGKNRPGKWSDSLSDYIYSWAKKQEQRGILSIGYKFSASNPVRFTTSYMSLVLPDVKDALSGWNTTNFYFYEVRNTKGECYIQLSIQVKNMPAELMPIYEQIYNEKPANTKNQYWIYEITDHFEFKENFSDEDVSLKMDEFLNKVWEFERELKTRLEESQKQ